MLGALSAHMILENARSAAYALRVNKLRSSLAMLGIIIGVGSVIAMVAVGAGAHARVTEQIQSLGANLIIVTAGSRSSSGVRGGQGSQVTLMAYLLAAIGSVSLLVGGIGIMNIMLVSVTERTREIGLRMAVGARSRDILTQFLVAAVTLSLIGGAFGIAVGVGGASAISYFAEWRTLIEAELIVVACGVATAVGIVFGFYPAYRAARLDPMEALRYE